MAIFSVTLLNEYVSKLLARDAMLKNIQLRGEISGFKMHTSGHTYFALKDDQALIRCVMFRQNGSLLKFLPEDGMQVQVGGYVSIYSRDGQYQFYVQSMDQVGKGELYERFLKAKEALEKEGLFDQLHKRKIPFLPKAVGVVTSPTGAVIEDIQNIIKRRYPNMRIILFPAKVQGDGAACEIAAGIEALNKDDNVDVIIIGRGGGSIEDLWAFNEDIVARAIYSSKKPVISAVGHETDFTIADFVADLRAPTPSAAAELCVPVRAELVEAVAQAKSRLSAAMSRTIEDKKNMIRGLRNSHALHLPKIKLQQHKLYLVQLNEKLRWTIRNKYETRKGEFMACLARLDSLSPVSVLKRGYAIVKDDTGNSVKSIQELFPGKALLLHMQDGKAQATVDWVTQDGGKL